MNKIRYILDLSGIKMPDGVKAETENRINNAGALYEKKNGKRKAAVVFALVFAFVLTVLAVSAVTKYVNSNSTPIPQITDIVTEPDTEETSAPDYTDSAKDPEEDYYIFDLLYKDYYRYDIFKTTINLIKPSENGYLVASSDLSPLYRYFGDAAPSAEELCETLFAFYEDDRVIHFDGISDHKSVQYEKIANEFKSTDQSLLFSSYPDELHSEELILMTAKNGTFEYLLTLPVNISDTYIYGYNSTDKIGMITAGKYYISHQYMLNAEANVYKIRFEAGLPVIYAKYTTSKGSLILADDNNTFFFGLGLKSERSNNGNQKIISGKFKFNDNIYEFKNEENDMISPVYTQRGLTASSDLRIASLCDYPYSLPAYDKKDGLCSRKTVVDIINEYELQWFFPMYITVADDGIVQIIGDGITTGDEAYGTENEIYSTLYRLYGTAYENNIYTPYNGSALMPAFLSSTASIDYPDYSLGLCYLPETCDTPYFDKSYFNVDRKLMVVTMLDNEIVTTVYNGNAETISIDMLQEYVSDPADVSSFEPMFTSDLPYIKDTNYMYSPSRPFDIKYLPLLDEDITNTPKLFTELGLSVPEYEHLNYDYYKLNLGHREISVISVGEAKVYNDGYILDSSDFSYMQSSDLYSLIYNKSGDIQFIVNAYEEINGYIIDMTGCVCGKAETSGVYMFNTADPCFDLTVKGKDGVVTYLSYYSDISEERPDNTISEDTLLPEEEKYYVRTDTLLYLAYHMGETAPVIDLWDVTYDEQSGTYIMRANIMKLSNEKEVFGIKNKDKRIYSFYKDVSMILENGRVYWQCTDDRYAHGFYQLIVEYDGHDVEIRVGMET